MSKRAVAREYAMSVKEPGQTCRDAADFCVHKLRHLIRLWVNLLSWSICLIISVLPSLAIAKAKQIAYNLSIPRDVFFCMMTVAKQI